MHPDPEIAEVEARLARRRERLEHTLHETGQRALKTLASPAVMVGVVALGFLAGAGVSRRRLGGVAKREKAEKAGWAGVALSAAMWLVKQQFGGPAQIAQLILSRVKKKSPYPDSVRALPVTRAPHAYR